MYVLYLSLLSRSSTTIKQETKMEKNTLKRAKLDAAFLLKEL